MEIIVLTGMSGAGKSHASHVLEDAGYYCISNLPAPLIRTFAEQYLKSGGMGQKLAFVMDARGEVELDSLLSCRTALFEQSCEMKIIFLECADTVLINRYKETRRVHPLAALNGLTVSEALAKERCLLEGAKDHADYIIDTTSTSTAQLRNRILTILGVGEGEKIVVNCVSFGFKYGMPSDADLVFDVRCFPNPYWIEDLRPLTGLDASVQDYLFSHDVINDFLAKLYDMMDFLLPLYVEEGKSQLTVAIGCTGGKHRSVAFAEALSAHLKGKGVKTVNQHRDIVKKFIGDK